MIKTRGQGCCLVMAVGSRTAMVVLPGPWSSRLLGSSRSRLEHPHSGRQHQGEACRRRSHGITAIQPQFEGHRGSSSTQRNWVITANKKSVFHQLLNQNGRAICNSMGKTGEPLKLSNSYRGERRRAQPQSLPMGRATTIPAKRPDLARRRAA